MKVNILILILVSLFFFSCEQEVELKVNTSEPCYVIEALITLGEFAKVNIVESKNYGEDNQYPPVRNVMVSISDNTGEKEILELMASGLYESKEIKGIEGRTYHLNVEIEQQEYTSVATMPYAVPIEDMIMFKTTTDSYFPKITYNDPPGIRNYYRAILSINGKRMPGMEVMDDRDTDGKKNSSLILFDPDYNGGDDIKKGDVVRIEMQCLDKGAYTYFESLNRINESLANPTSNITGGVLGYFGVYTYDTKEIIADW
ncbi:DUF4249 domain-containing protein [Parabacteroides sp. OttesenSCG-928-G07]|nr:DUF4249 domain-containing protein [Parabacteroides sp. OttesenSCG-928-G21]MDL2277948.1 DUF4249 domain-containing protein [Parabacteroides sp. OttesenSCG-928-G07]